MNFKTIAKMQKNIFQDEEQQGTSYLKNIYSLKCKALAEKVQEIINEYRKLKLSFAEARELAYEETDYLRHIILQLPTTKMYFDKIRGTK